MTNWRHSAASPPCGSLVCARFIQLDRADAEHWQFPDREPKGRCPGKGTVRSSCVASLGNYSDRIRVRARESHIRSPALASAALAGIVYRRTPRRTSRNQSRSAGVFSSHARTRDEKNQRGRSWPVALFQRSSYQVNG